MLIAFQAETHEGGEKRGIQTAADACKKILAKKDT